MLVIEIKIQSPKYKNVSSNRRDKHTENNIKGVLSG